jgi:ferrous iron transport protein A
MTLGELKIGDKAIIKSFNNAKLALRLLEMGCLPGEEVKVMSSTPMGDPIIIELNAGLYALRLENAKEIEVMPCH